MQLHSVRHNHCCDKFDDNGLTVAYFKVNMFVKERRYKSMSLTCQTLHFIHSLYYMYSLEEQDS